MPVPRQGVRHATHPQAQSMDIRSAIMCSADVSLKNARDLRDAARRDLASGIDPMMRRTSEGGAPSNSFKSVALELFAVLRRSSLAGERAPPEADEVSQRTIQPRRKRKVRTRERISAGTIDTMQRRVELHVFPHIGGFDVGDVKPSELLDVLRRIEARGTFELAHRVRSICSPVFRYARATDRECSDVAADLIGMLAPVEPENMAAITDPARVGDLLSSIDKAPLAQSEAFRKRSSGPRWRRLGQLRPASIFYHPGQISWQKLPCESLGFQLQEGQSTRGEQ